ncbi:response regulator [Paenibacillus frigoriresistens]|uniref:response regulator n=1 Tax=Paenibacillus alginolyticus TaxID=59839 RepID=UPI0015653BA7|nr:response regulator [Paenibacillus frigoriresistens]NRF96189.1 response regulator [Paenibacillus frigoriresistens]
MKKVVIVDDNEMSLQGLCTNIDWYAIGAEVYATYTRAAEVLEILKEVEIDLLISDIAMPQMNGLELSKEILKARPYMKIILISAYDDFDYAKEAIRLGVCDYVEKPVDYGYLTQISSNVFAKAEQEQKALEQLKQSRPALMQKFYSDLIGASPDYAEFHLTDQAAYLNVDLRQEEYVCAIIQIDNSIETKNNFGIERYHVLLLTLLREVEHMFLKLSLVYCFTQANNIIIILGNCNRNNLNFLRTVYDQLSELNEKYEASPLSFTIGIGDIVPSIWQISASFENARSAAGFKFIFGEGHVFNIQDIRTHPATPISFMVGHEDKLIRLISQKDLVGLREFTENLTSEWSSRYYDKNGIIASIYSLLARLIRFFYDTGIDAGLILESISDLFSKLDRYETVAQLCDRLYEICTQACNKLQESVETYHNQIAEQVMDFIKQHYMDVDLNLNTISSFVNVSPTYLGALFKRAKGQTISDNITSVRISKAKELLRHTHMKIMEISEKVGYANQYYFSANFKKRTGETPRDYRAAVQGIEASD